MVPSYQTPGIYIEEIPQLPPQVVQAETTMVAFIGYTEKACQQLADDLLFTPLPIRSMLEFEQYYGGPCLLADVQLTVEQSPLHVNIDTFTPPVFILYDALQLFFANGGLQCLIVSTGNYSATLPALEPLLHGLAAIEHIQTVSLIVAPEAHRLTIDSYQLFTAATLQQCASLGDRFAVIDMHGGTERLDQPHSDISEAVQQFRAAGCPDQHLQYGAAYAPHLQTSYPYQADHTRIQVSLAADQEAVSLYSLQASQPEIYAACLQALQTRYLLLPPSAAVAGVYAHTDTQRGVWKAPANASLTGIMRPCLAINNTEHGIMNVDTVAGKSVNAIRAFTGKGTLVWGARTLAGNDNEWRYINVRRFALMLETSCKRALASFAFEPNDANSWVRIQGMLENFLTLCWRQGALQGSKPEHAFYVRVGLGQSMTARDVAEGRLYVELGFAAVRPAEFIVLRLCQLMQQ